MSWWLFGFQTFELLQVQETLWPSRQANGFSQAMLVALVLMAATSLVRQMDPTELWQKLPSQEELQSHMPQQVLEQHLAKAWQRLLHASLMAP